MLSAHPYSQPNAVAKLNIHFRIYVDCRFLQSLLLNAQVQPQQHHLDTLDEQGKRSSNEDI